MICRNSDKIPLEPRRKITELSTFQKHFAKFFKKCHNFAKFPTSDLKKCILNLDYEHAFLKSNFENNYTDY